MIGRLRRMFAQPGFAVLLAVLGLIAINWPFLALAHAAGELAVFGYLFGVWALMVLLAFLISRAVTDSKPEGGEGDV